MDKELEIQGSTHDKERRKKKLIKINILHLSLKKDDNG